MFTLSDTNIDPAALGWAMAQPRAGALATFEGWVRNLHEAHAVSRLTYEAYGPLAIKEGNRILAAVKAAHDVLDAQCVHRIGSLEVGEIAIWVGVTAEHRGPALATCQQIIDEIKHSVPIWKKEFYSDGSMAWVNCAHEAKAAGRL